MKFATVQPAHHPQPATKALALAYLMFDWSDLEYAEWFLNDFGLVAVQRNESTLLLRDTGPAPFCYVMRKVPKATFASFGLQVTGRVALDALTKLPGASTMEPLDWPGGGYHVRFVDPSGFRVDAIADRALATELPHRSVLSFNPMDAPLHINGTQRPLVGTPEAIRLGRVVLEFADFQATCAWYTQHSGLTPSDVQVLSDGPPVVVFIQPNLSDTPANHHALVLTQGFVSKYSHSALELIDADTVGMGYRMLREQEWKHTQGLGWHILGNQIPNYWQDPRGDKHEHYCDGDLFIADQPTSIYPVSHEAISQRGQSMPASFIKPKLTLAATAALIRSLRRSPDLTLRKLVTSAWIFA